MNVLDVIAWAVIAGSVAVIGFNVWMMSKQ